MAENDQDIHVVYLLALAYHAGGQSDTALEVLGDGEKLLEANKHHQDIDMILTGFATLKVSDPPICPLGRVSKSLSLRTQRFCIELSIPTYIFELD